MTKHAPKMKMTTEIPAAYTAAGEGRIPPWVRSHYFDGVPSEATIENAIYDYLDTLAGRECLSQFAFPSLSMNALREGQAAMGADTCNKICIFDTLMDSKTHPADR